jgi:hypothetical protein
VHFCQRRRDKEHALQAVVPDDLNPLQPAVEEVQGLGVRPLFPHSQLRLRLLRRGRHAANDGLHFGLHLLAAVGQLLDEREHVSHLAKHAFLARFICVAALFFHLQDLLVIGDQPQPQQRRLELVAEQLVYGLLTSDSLTIGRISCTSRRVLRRVWLAPLHQARERLHCLRLELLDLAFAFFHTQILLDLGKARSEDGLTALGQVRLDQRILVIHARALRALQAQRTTPVNADIHPLCTLQKTNTNFTPVSLIPQ